MTAKRPDQDHHRTPPRIRTGRIMNPIYDAEREEHLSALRQLSYADRAASCGHLVRVHGVCYDCGDDIQGEL